LEPFAERLPVLRAYSTLGTRADADFVLWTVSERALRRAGCDTIERLDLCTRCNPELFFSERLTGKPRGTHGVIGLVA